MDVSTRMKKVSTHIDNLYLWSTKEPLYWRAAVDFGLELKADGNVKAISLELDRSLQGFLDDYYKRKKKIESKMVPGFGYAINYGIMHRVPIYASDKHEKEFSMKIYELSSVTKEKIVDSTDEEFRKIMNEWDEAFTSFENTRAEGTAKNLEEIAKKTDGKVIHLCSENMAKKIIEII